MEKKFDRSKNLTHFFYNSCNDKRIFLPEQTIDDKLKYDYIFVNLDEWYEKQRSERKNPIKDYHPSWEDELLQYVKKLLQSNLTLCGRIVLLCNNALGIHAFATGLFNQTCEMEKYFSYQMLSRLIHQLGKVHVKWYYPYPSIELMQAVYSDLHLPSHGECDENHYNFDRVELECFDEQKAVDEIVMKEMYPYMANAYMLLLEPGHEDEDKNTCVKGTEQGAYGRQSCLFADLPDYVRFSNERRTDCQIQTELYADHVTKRAYTQKAAAHIKEIKKNEKALAKELDGVMVLNRPLQVNSMLQYNEAQASAEFEYVKGLSLEAILDEMASCGKNKQVTDILNSFCKALRTLASVHTFIPGKDFYEVFGNTEPMQSLFSKEEFTCLQYSNIDMICQNILVDEERAVLIDYEWTFSFPIPVDFLIYRILFFFLEGKNREWGKQDCYKSLYIQNGISHSYIKVFEQMETAFQKYVQKGACIVRNEYDLHGRQVISHESLDKMRMALDRQRILVKQSNGMENVYFGSRKSGIISYRIGAFTQKVCIDIKDMLSGDAKLLRLGLLAEKDGNSRMPVYEVKAKKVAGMIYLFDGKETEIEVYVNPGEQILLSLEQIDISEHAQKEILDTIHELRFLVDNREEQLSQMKNSASWKVTAPLRKIKGQK